jgi:DNA-binding HxlR family transcriptional regulator
MRRDMAIFVVIIAIALVGMASGASRIYERAMIEGTRCANVAIGSTQTNGSLIGGVSNALPTSNSFPIDDLKFAEKNHIMLAALLGVTTQRRKRLGIEEACRIMREIMAPLEKERRITILKNLPPGEKKTFGELEVATGFSAGSLHDHLKALVGLGYVHRTEERPVKYYGDERLVHLCELAAELKAKKVETLKKELAECQSGYSISPESRWVEC